MAKPEIRLKGFDGEWKAAQLDTCVDFLDNLRKPIKEGYRIKGIYPYYGASGIVDYINDYIFDEEQLRKEIEQQKIIFEQQNHESDK